MDKNLGNNETKILSALLLGEKYGLDIIETLQKETGKGISLGGLYTTMHRLEKKGFVKSRWGESTAERGGNRRKYYKLTGTGERVLREVKQSLSLLLNWEVQGA